MVTVAQKKQFKAFANRWHDRGYEKGDTAQFWLELLRLIGYEVEGTSPFEHHLANGGFIDVWLRDAGVLVEQKALGVDLDRPELRQGVMKTPLEQALHYADDLPLSQQPRWVLTCNFATFRVYDREAHAKSQLAAHGFEFSLAELGEHPEYLAFIRDAKAAKQEKELQVSIRAGELVGELYDRLRTGYLDPDSDDSMHALNVLCVRVVFCLFCEDSDLFEKDAFYHYLKDVPAPYLRDALRKLFRALDTPLDARDPYDTTVQGFPYVNGGLFREEVQVPNISDKTKQFLLEDISAAVDWSEISPTIFGGIFEGTLNPVTRRQGGMHYTSPENIHKVIDPLFLDGLKGEFTAIQTDAGLTPRQRKNRYARLHRRICSLTFFDPACGSGNFLTETYLSLRKLEDALLHELRGGQMGLGLDIDEGSGTRVSLSQFYGIEINDFAVTVAETALWISRLKANGETMMLLDVDADDFPLTESAHVVHGNALRTDWNEVLPAEQCSYVMGNPPFLGYSNQSPEQKQEMREIWLGVDGKPIKAAGKIDYVSAWYYKAVQFAKDTNARCAFVSTNSICQGEQVAPIWMTLKDCFGVHIDFAWRPFVWNNEATDQAHVHCVIVGFSTSQSDTCLLYEEDGNASVVDHINGYLIAAPDAYVSPARKPLCDIPQMSTGNRPADGGHLIIEAGEYRAFLDAEPAAKPYIRPFLGSREFINGLKRWCLWLVGVDQNTIDSLPAVAKRVEACRADRLAALDAGRRKLAEIPSLFRETTASSHPYLVVPKVSSARRHYVPVGYVPAETICSDLLFMVPEGGLYEFGVVASMRHNAWMRAVAGRLKSDYRYSQNLVYNTFPWPDPTPEQRSRIEACAQAVLDARAAHPGDSLATLYDPDLMPADLLAAHHALDAAVEAAYGVDFAGDETQIVAHLFRLYAQTAS